MYICVYQKYIKSEEIIYSVLGDHNNDKMKYILTDDFIAVQRIESKYAWGSCFVSKLWAQVLGVMDAVWGCSMICIVVYHSHKSR